MGAFRLCITLVLFVFQISLNAVVYLEKPEEFNPKVEVSACFLDYQDKILILHR